MSVFISSTHFIMSKIQPFASLDFCLRNKVLLKNRFTTSGSIISVFFTKKTLPDSATFEISILQPTQPALLAVGANGCLFIIISSVKNCFGIIKKSLTLQFFEYVRKKKFGLLSEFILSIIVE